MCLKAHDSLLHKSGGSYSAINQECDTRVQRNPRSTWRSYSKGKGKGNYFSVNLIGDVKHRAVGYLRPMKRSDVMSL